MDMHSWCAFVFSYICRWQMCCAELQGVGGEVGGCSCSRREWVMCAISITNCGEGKEIVAWAGAQVHYQCCYQENVVHVHVFSGLRPRGEPRNAVIQNL